MKKILKALMIGFNTISHPSHLTILFRDLFRKLHLPDSDNIHLDAAMDWLCHSQDVAQGGGCSGIYTFETGWTAPYPETTGYIIPTFIEYGELKNKPDYLERAKRMGDWEISIQLKSGAVRGGVGINEYPIVFNTGQVIFGWVALYKKTEDAKYLDAAIRASGWLVSNMDEDGKWSKNTFNKIPHAYNIRVTWALLEVAALTQNNKFKTAAIKNINWVLAQANENSWIGYMGFTLNEQPLTHTIAYTLRGLLECSFFVEKELQDKILNHVISASDKIINKYNAIQTAESIHNKGFMPGTFDNNWNSNARFTCLTGDVQLAIIWMKLFKITGNKSLLEIAFKNIEQVKSTQDLKSKNIGIRGGIAGSYPIWGKYTNFGYPNWAAKFFAEALMFKNTITT